MIIATDFDGTLTTGQMGKATGKYLSQNGKADLYRPFFWQQLPRYILARLGLMDMRDFKKGWALDMVALFRGFTSDELERMFEWVVENELWPKRRPKVIAELQQLRADGHQVLAVSGAYQPLLEAFCRRLDFEAIGTYLEMDNGLATGRIVEPLNVGDSKVQRLRDALNGEPLAIAYGDSMDDVPMLELSEQPVATYPDKKLQRFADAHNWRILNDDLV